MVRSAFLAHLKKLQLSLVCALAAFTLLLNLVSPFEWAFRFRADVIASESRFRALSDALSKPDSPLSVKVTPSRSMLLELPFQTSVSTKMPNLQVQEVEVVCRYNIKPEQLSQCLSNVSARNKASARQLLSKEARMNRWMITVLEHQIDRQEWKDDESSKATAADEEVSSSTSPYRLVSSSSFSKSSIIDGLRSELASRKLKEQEDARLREQSQIESYGVVSLASPWINHAFPYKHKLQWILLCVIGACLISLAFSYADHVLAAIQHTKPESFEAAMRRLKIEPIGSIGSTHSPAPVQKGLKHNSARHAQELAFRVSDWVVFLTVTACATRYAFDDSWRDVLHTSPLAALATCYFGV